MNTEVYEKINKLIEELASILGGSAVPCDGEKDGKSCLRRLGEEHRKSDGGNVLWYDTDCTAANRLCQACQAYWHIMVARNNVDRQSRKDAIFAAEKAREAQRGDPA